MGKKITTIIAALVMAAMPCLMITEPAFATGSNDPCDKNSKFYVEDPNREALCNKGSESDAEKRVKGILSLVFTILGVISVIVIIVGGFFYITSQGDPGKISKAKSAILYAVIGLVVSLLAFAIVNFVVGHV